MTVSNSIGTGNAVAFTMVGDLAMEDAKVKAGEYQDEVNAESKCAGLSSTCIFDMQLGFD